MGSTENGDIESGSRPAMTMVGDSSFGNINVLLKRFIASSTEETWKDEGFLSVVNAYVESSKRSQEFCVSVEVYLRGLTEMLLIMRYVIELYDREVANEPRKYSRSSSRMLGDLLEFKAKGGDALGDAFVKVIRSMYEPEGGMDYVTVLEELQRAETTIESAHKDVLRDTYKAADEEHWLVNKMSSNHTMQLEKRLKRIRRWENASKMMFGIGFFTVPILTAFVMVVPVPSAIEVLVGAFSATVGSVGKWCSYLWNKRESAAEFQKNGVALIERVHTIFGATLLEMNQQLESIFTATNDMPSMADFMIKVEQMDRKSMVKITKMVIDSLELVKNANECASIFKRAITYSTEQASQRLGTLPAAYTSKPRSWMGIFM